MKDNVYIDKDSIPEVPKKPEPKKKKEPTKKYNLLINEYEKKSFFTKCSLLHIYL